MMEIFGNSVDLSEMPWYVGLIGMVLASLLSFVATRLTSKDKTESEIFQQTIKRQGELDERTDKFIDDFQEEIKALRKDHQQLRSELNAERRKTTTFETKITGLEKQNLSLVHENDTLRKSLQNVEGDLRKLREELEEERKKTYGFKNTVREHEKEIARLNKERQYLIAKLEEHNITY